MTMAAMMIQDNARGGNARCAEKVIAVFGGGLVKDTSRWRTTNFDESDDFAPLGDRLRVLAAAALYKGGRERGEGVLLVALGGRGQLRGIADSPSVASVMRHELVAEGVPGEDVMIEEESGNTYEQLCGLNALARQKEWERITLCSNRYQLPRIAAMIAHAPRLGLLKGKYAGGRLSFLAAEDVLLRDDPLKWKRAVADAYQTEGMRRRAALEEKGVQQIKEGTYRFSVSNDAGGAAQPAPRDTLEEVCDFSLRKAAHSDCEFLFDLRNDEAVRRFSLRQDPILREAHRAWFAKRQADPRCAIFVAEARGGRIGQVRFDVREENREEAEISIALIASARGRGCGSRMILKAVREFILSFPRVARVYAYINLGNGASLRAFQKAGFELLGTSERGGAKRHELVLRLATRKN